MSNVFRRTSFLLAASLIAATVSAQTYPSRTIRGVAPLPSGTASDTIARILAVPMSQSLGQQVLIDNKPGADGAIASADVMRAAPDGYTIYFATNSPLAAVPSMRRTPPYDPVTDFTPIGNVGRFTHFVVVHPGVPATTMAEFVAHAKANAGKLNYATGNTTSIVSLAQLFRLTGMTMQHVPFKGDPAALIDVIAGRVQFMMATQGQAIAFIRDGKLRALASTGGKRSTLAPEVPTLNEVGLQFPLLSWMVLVGPAKMRPEVVERVNRELNAALQIPKVQEDIAKQAFEVVASTPEELRAFLVQQKDIWGRTVKELGLQTD